MWDFFIFLPRRNNCSSTIHSFNGVLTSELRRRETADMEACGKTCSFIGPHESPWDKGLVSAADVQRSFLKTFIRFLPRLLLLSRSCECKPLRLTNSPHVYVLGLSGGRTHADTGGTLDVRRQSDNRCTTASLPIWKNYRCRKVVFMVHLTLKVCCCFPFPFFFYLFFFFYIY